MQQTSTAFSTASWLLLQLSGFVSPWLIAAFLCCCQLLFATRLLMLHLPLPVDWLFPHNCCFLCQCQLNCYLFCANWLNFLLPLLAAGHWHHWSIAAFFPPFAHAEWKWNRWHMHVPQHWKRFCNPMLPAHHWYCHHHCCHGHTCCIWQLCSQVMLHGLFLLVVLVVVVAVAHDNDNYDDMMQAVPHNCLRSK